MKEQLAQLSIKDDVSIITLDDGKANVFSPQMIQDINDCLDKVPTQKVAHLLLPGVRACFLLVLI